MARIEKPIAESRSLRVRTGAAGGQRDLLNEKMVRNILVQIAGSNRDSLKEYTFTRRHSDYPGARADFEVFDGSGQLTIYGREFRAGPFAFWRQVRVTATPEFA
jgi:hypothetical protein